MERGRQAPRTWGWTRRGRGPHPRIPAGPTHVGMDRRSSADQPRAGGRRRARGEGPGGQVVVPRYGLQAPRTWGWTAETSLGDGYGAAGPTHVGMDHAWSIRWYRIPCRPHARGDGPRALRPGPL